ncbi:MAG: antitoxin VbhA family protein [Sciscionella sp.]
MSAEFIAPIGVDEARRRLPEIASGFRNHSREEPVIVGAYRHADFVMISMDEYREVKKLRDECARLTRSMAAAEALGSIRAEGLELTEEGDADTRRFIAGDLTVDELVSRAVARHRS